MSHYQATALTLVERFNAKKQITNTQLVTDFFSSLSHGAIMIQGTRIKSREFKE